MLTLIIFAAFLTIVFGTVLVIGLTEMDDDVAFAGLLAIILVWVVVAIIGSDVSQNNKIDELQKQHNKDKAIICHLRGGHIVDDGTCIKGKVIK